MRGQALQFLPIITEAQSNECVQRLAALIGLTNAKAHVQQVALGLFSWSNLLLHCLISTTGAKGTSQGMFIIHANQVS